MNPPRFWAAGLDPRSREAAPLVRALLTPLASLYCWGVKRKIATANPMPVDALVICVGNLTVGGVGKTPIVQALRAHLQAQRLRTASLSRGYGGSMTGPLRVSLADHSAAEVGDEPVMLADSGESWIGADRFAAAREMTADGVQAIIMDDGFQNPALAKDVSVVVIDAGAPFGNGYVLPKGPLREPVFHGLARADAICLIGDGEVPTAVIASGLPVVRATLVATGSAPTGKLIAFAGIGRPQKFFDGLANAGGDIVEAVPFADHYSYKPSDMKYLRALAETHDGQLVTTEKDYARLSPTDRTSIEVFKVYAQFDSLAPLDALIARALEPKGR